jgi:acyl-CoA thioester hydrolase
MPRFIENVAEAACPPAAASRATAQRQALIVAVISAIGVLPDGDTCQQVPGKKSAMGDHGEHERLSEGLSGALTAQGHRLLARVYYADTDFSGVVYHARYLEFLERGRSDYLRLSGVHHTELAEGRHGEKIVWVVRRMEIDFRLPARIDDIITIETRTDSISGARIYMAQKLLRGEDLLVEARVEAAIIGESGRPKRFPREWMAAFLPTAG